MSRGRSPVVVTHTLSQSTERTLRFEISVFPPLYAHTTRCRWTVCHTVVSIICNVCSLGGVGVARRGRLGNGRSYWSGRERSIGHVFGARSRSRTACHRYRYWGSARMTLCGMGGLGRHRERFATSVRRLIPTRDRGCDRVIRSPSRRRTRLLPVAVTSPFSIVRLNPQYLHHRTRKQPTFFRNMISADLQKPRNTTLCVR